jgi:hypothetical protein
MIAAIARRCGGDWQDKKLGARDRKTKRDRDLLMEDLNTNSAETR